MDKTSSCTNTEKKTGVVYMYLWENVSQTLQYDYNDVRMN